MAKKQLHEAYWTVLVPYADKGTKWHPTEKKGPFSVLSRGAFRTREEAIEWAQAHLQGFPYELKFFYCDPVAASGVGNENESYD